MITELARELVSDGRTDCRTTPLIEIQGRIHQPRNSPIKKASCCFVFEVVFLDIEDKTYNTKMHPLAQLLVTIKKTTLLRKFEIKII